MSDPRRALAGTFQATKTILENRTDRSGIASLTSDFRPARTASTSRVLPEASQARNSSLSHRPGRPVPGNATTYGRRLSANVTVAVSARVTVSLHAGPEQAPLRAGGADPGSATASSVAFVPFVIETQHFVPQSMPAPPTKPWPVPAFLTVSMNLCAGGGGTPKPAVSDLEPFEPWPVKVIVHVDADPANAQSPPRPRTSHRAPGSP